MKLDVVTLEGKKVSSLELEAEIAEAPVREDLMARVVHWQLAKRRAGTHKTKGISEVSGSTKKIVRQKGSGGARHGSKRAPQFRGGSVIFGPVVRDHGYSLPKKIRKMGLHSAFLAKLRGNDLIVVDSFDSAPLKTQGFLKVLEGLKADHSALLIGRDIGESHVATAIRNLPNIDVLPPVGANVYDMLKHRKLIVSKDAILDLQERFK